MAIDIGMTMPTMLHHDRTDVLDWCRAIDGRFDHRWQRMADQIAAMRRIWAGEAPFDDADPVGPPPVQPGGPPLVAGSMGPKALARAARWAVGVDHGGSILGLRAKGTDTTSILDFSPDE